MLGNMRFNWPIIGHKGIVHFLQKSIEKDKVSHAYLFLGLEGTGKSTAIFSFVASLLCSKQEGLVIPCGKCFHCREFKKNTHPDVIRVIKAEDKKNISIEQVRDIINRLSSTSLLKSYKIAIIEGAEALSLEASNALLKILEEPPGQTVIILSSRFKSALPATIISRAQILPFQLQPFDIILKELKDRGESPLRARKIAQMSFGRPGLALKLLENSFFQERINLIKAFFNFFSSSLNERFRLITDNLSEYNTDALLDVWITALRDSLLVKAGLAEEITYTDYEKEINLFIKERSMENIVGLFEKAKEIKWAIFRNVNPRFALENLALEI